MNSLTNTNGIGDSLFNALLLTDGYKLGHKSMYPKGITQLYSNFTPRSSRYFPEADAGVVVFGIQYFIKKYLVDEFNNHFFNLPKQEVLDSYSKRLETFLGPKVANKIGLSHIAELHDLGYLPIIIKSIDEGSYCPIGVPVLTISNTDDRFAWLTNYLETLMSAALWLPMTSATTADVFKRELIRHAKKTGFFNKDDYSNLNFLCHDFSMRGMHGIEAAISSGMAHLTSFTGTETLPAIGALEYYYGADASKELIAGTVPATEHSIECSNATDADGNADDETYFKNILDLFPSGMISVVADGYDYWKFIGEIVPKYKYDILARDGRVIIRPDSGDPVKIICGDPDAEDPIVKMGSYEFLWNTFGGKYNEKGYKELDPKIGLIYGDSITMKRQADIYAKLEDKGFAATNLVLGLGSFSYGMRSRDSLGFAMKATYCKIDGQGKEIFKNPKTVIGMPKKSHRGLLKVCTNSDRTLSVKDQCTPEEEMEGMLVTRFINGEMKNTTTLSRIRELRRVLVNDFNENYWRK